MWEGLSKMNNLVWQREEGVRTFSQKYKYSSTKIYAQTLFMNDPLAGYNVLILAKFYNGKLGLMEWSLK